MRYLWSTWLLYTWLCYFESFFVPYSHSGLCRLFHSEMNDSMYQLVSMKEFPPPPTTSPVLIRHQMFTPISATLTYY